MNVPEFIKMKCNLSTLVSYSMADAAYKRRPRMLACLSRSIVNATCCCRKKRKKRRRRGIDFESKCQKEAGLHQREEKEKRNLLLEAAKKEACIAKAANQCNPPSVYVLSYLLSLSLC
jgi:hypothetical protein